MALSSLIRRVVAPVAALALASPALIALTASQSAAATTLLPFVISNQSGRSDATYVYIIARDQTSGAQGYVDSSGTWHAFSFPTSGSNVPAPDVSIAGPSNGTNETLQLPPNLSGGRAYVSFAQKLQFFLSPNGLVEPAAWNPTDPNHDILFDWTEFARSGTAIDINTTMVDMFSVPMAVSVTNGSGTTQTEGQLVSGGRDNIFNTIRNLGGDWPNLIYTRSDGLPLRVMAPIHGITAATPVFSSTFFDSYVSAVWSYYASHVLTVNTSVGTFTGTVSNGAFTFRDSNGTVIGSLNQPSTAETFGCYGSMQPGGQPNETAILAVGARVCAALNRATLSTATRPESDTQPTSDSSTFYQQSISNLYSKAMHDNSVDGKAYGFSFDDVAGFSPSIDESNPTSVTLTLSPFTGGATSGASGPVKSAFVGKCMDVSGANSANGTVVQEWDCNGTNAQVWTQYSDGTLRALGKCLDATGAATADGTKLEIWDCNGGGNQVWKPSNAGYVNPVSGRCIDDPNGSTTNGTQLQLWDCNGTAAQVWSTPGGSVGNTGGPAGYTFCANENGTCTFSGTANVAFGADTRFNYASATNSIACNTSTFGDPYPGVVKACYYQLTSTGTSATSTIQAENYNNQSGTQTETCSDTGGGQDVGWISNGDWLEYDNINFGSTGLTQFQARVASGAASGVSGTVSVVLDNINNAPIGSFSIGNTGGWQSWTTVPTNISTTTGTHTVYLKFSTGSGQDFVNVNWFTF